MTNLAFTDFKNIVYGRKVNGQFPQKLYIPRKVLIHRVSLMIKNGRNRKHSMKKNLSFGIFLKFVLDVDTTLILPNRIELIKSWTLICTLTIEVSIQSDFERISFTLCRPNGMSFHSLLFCSNRKSRLQYPCRIRNDMKARYGRR